jgi:hypothetical protein
VSFGAGAVALAAPVSADTLTTPTPAPASATTLTFTSSHDGLVNGQAINFHVDTTAPDSLNLVEAHICQTGFTTYSLAQFNYATGGTRCVYGPGVTSGLLSGVEGSIANPTAPSYKLGPLPFSSVTTSGPQTFHAGTSNSPGSPVSWFNSASQAGNGGSPLACDATHNCDLVVRVGLTGDTNVTDTFFIQPLTFAGAPAAPAPSVGTAGNTAVTINWPLLAAGVPSGNGTIDKYTITATPHTPGVGSCPATGPAPTNVTTGFSGPGSPVTATSANITGLANFCQYDFSMTAENVASDNSTHFTSPISGIVSATPTQAGPATVSAAPGNHQVTLTISPVAGATDYQVQVSPAPGGTSNCASGTCLTGGLTNFTVNGLTNGTPYTFTVAAVIGANITSGTVATATPNGTLITQTIDVVRPAGTLVISQYCSGQPLNLQGFFDPSNNNGNTTPNAVPLTNCNLTLSGPRLDHLQNNAVTASGRSVQDAVTNGTTTVSSPSIGFTANDVDQLVTGDGIPTGTRVASVTNGTTAVLTNAATSTLSSGQLQILGTTVHFGSVTGNTITPDGTSALAAGDVGKEIEGFQIPGGSTITNVLNPSTFDISQPADTASNGFSTREWLEAPTPAHLITTGPHAGQYFQAIGQLRQVIVVDTRSGADTGWTATGQVTDFSDGVHSFSGDNLGWTPQPMHAFSQPFNSPDGPYSMAPAAGGLVTPGTVPGLHSGTSASTDTSVAGPIPGMTLAYANAGHGLGLAQLDANLTLWIPVFDMAGNYSAVLTLTAV